MKFAMSVAMSDPSHYLPLAQCAEEHGFASVAVPDSIFFSEEVSAPYPYTSDGNRMWGAETPWIEPFVAIPAMAAVTKSIRFYTNVLKLAVRNPLLVAKQAGSIAVMSNNRFGLGVGLGWLPEEFKWCGTDYATRGKRGNEAIEILQRVLAGGMVDYEGEHYQFGKIQMSPAPSERVPIYVGGHSKPGLRRAAKYADGWASAMTTKTQLLGYIEQLTALRQQYGRAEVPFEIQAVCTDVYDADGYRALQEAGVTEIVTIPWMMYGVPINGDLDAKLDGVKRYAEKLVQPLA